jgi:NTE family protein
MTETNVARDIHSQFAENSTGGDLLNARKVEDNIGLCLSGGGYRATIYHLGALIRLNELGYLARISEVASVSGGSITAGLLALRWKDLDFDTSGYAKNFHQEVVVPLLNFVGVGIDLRAILYSFLPGCTAADSIAYYYDRLLFNGASLQDLSDTPRFTFMATNLQTGSGWRFSKGYAADYRVGIIEKPDLALSRVVAASSAFPPLLSPVTIDFTGQRIRATVGADLHRPPYTEHAILTDGGVYDNLGLERVWKRCRTILVSDAGKTIPDVGRPGGRWIGQTYRTLSIIQQQVQNSRLRILFGMANLGQRNVVYWDIGTAPEQYGIEYPLELSRDEARHAADMRTRLNQFSKSEQQLLIKAGYASADASLKARAAIPDAASNYPVVP